MKSSLPIAVAALACFVAPSAFAGLKFETKRVELKALPEDSQLVAEFSFVNEGKESATIWRVDTSCGCLSAETDKTEYAPGEKGTVKAVFDLGSFTGQQEKALTVMTTEKGDEGNRLIVSVEIPDVFVVEPDLLEWEIGEKPATKSFKIKVPHTDPIHIITIAPSRDNFQYELVENEPGRDYEIKLTPVSTETPMLGVLKITTDCRIEKHRRQLAFFSINRPKPAPAAPKVVPGRP